MSRLVVGRGLRRLTALVRGAHEAAFRAGRSLRPGARRATRDRLCSPGSMIAPRRRHSWAQMPQPLHWSAWIWTLRRVRVSHARAASTGVTVYVAPSGAPSAPTGAAGTVHQVERRTSGLQAAFAAVAEVGVDRPGCAVDPVLQHARRLGDDHRSLVRRQLLAQHALDLCHVQRVDLHDAVDARIRGRSSGCPPPEPAAHQGLAGAGVLLAAGHAGGAVVEDERERPAAVVGDVEERGEAGVEERAVADDGHRLRAQVRLGAGRACGAITWSIPWAMPMLAPMHTHECMDSNGARRPACSSRCRRSRTP